MMGYKASRVTVTTLATSLAPAAGTNGSPGRSLVVRNISDQEIRTGGPDVTWGTGMPLYDGEVKSYEDLDYQVPFAVTQSGSVEVVVEQEGL